MKLLKTGLEWAKKKPDYTRIAMLMEIDDSKFIAKLRTMAAQGYDMLRNMIVRDQMRGLIKQEADSDLIVDIISTLNIHLLKDYLSADSSNMDKMTEKAGEILKIIKEGIMPRN